MNSKTRLLITGVTRNSSYFIGEEVRRIENAASRVFNTVEWFIVESDSSDGTDRILDVLKKQKHNFDFLSLGSLSENFPRRTHRIALCRNRYVEYLRKHGDRFDYVLAVDLDRLNKKLTSLSLESCFRRTDWDACFANQKGPYYDIWALRHPQWCPNDCLVQRDFLQEVGVPHYTAIKISIHSKMIKLPPNLPWIKVDSAFGGAGLYRSEVFQYAWYSGYGTFREEMCEHVPFNRKLVEQGFKLFINPQFINANYTEHTRNLRFPNSVAFRMKKILVQVIKRLRKRESEKMLSEGS